MKKREAAKCTLQRGCQSFMSLANRRNSGQPGEAPVPPPPAGATGTNPTLGRLAASTRNCDPVLSRLGRLGARVALIGHRPNSDRLARFLMNPLLASLADFRAIMFVGRRSCSDTGNPSVSDRHVYLSSLFPLCSVIFRSVRPLSGVDAACGLSKIAPTVLPWPDLEQQKNASQGLAVIRSRNHA